LLLHSIDRITEHRGIKHIRSREEEEEGDSSEEEAAGGAGGGKRKGNGVLPGTFPGMSREEYAGNGKYY